MPTVRGQTDVKRFIAQVPKTLAQQILPGAARAGARVVADEAKVRVRSQLVRDAIRVAVKSAPGKVVAKVQVVGKGAFIAPWLEYGTAPHFIRVSDERRGGLSIGKLNKRIAEGSLVINGKFVGDEVFHPGAKPYPFLRPALDAKEREAITAAQGYIDGRVARMRKSGLLAAEEPDE